MPLGNFGVKEISQYFNSGPYCVPEYQRDYSWETNLEVKELWDDIIAVKRDGLSDFFLGQLVVHSVEESDGTRYKYIIDGQQRSITLMILLLAIRNKFKELKAQGKSENIEEADKAGKTATKIDVLLGVIDKEDNEDKLILGDADKDFFRNSIVYSDSSSIMNENPKKKARKNLVAAYRFFIKA